MYTNADQLQNKRDDLLMVIAHDRPDIIFITECLPKALMCPASSALYSIPGYTLFTNFDFDTVKDGCKKSIRGICIFVEVSIQADEIAFAQFDSIEHLWISVRLRGSDLLTAGCIYRSPSVNAHQSIDELARLLHSVVLSCPSHLLICGDFNIPQIDWSTSFCHAPDSHFAHRFLDVIQDCLLHQHVTRPTRFRDGEEPHLLDLLFTNEEGMVTALEYLPGLGKSDHIVLCFRLACYTSLPPTSTERLNLNRANWDKLNEGIARVNWEHLTSLDVQTGYAFFNESLQRLMSLYIPKGRSSKMRKNIYMTSHALKLKKEKNKLWDKYASTRDPLALARFRVSRNRLRRLTRKLRRDFEHRLASGIKSNPKAFWRYSNTRLRTKTSIGSLRSPSGEVASSHEEKANVLNCFFGSVFTRENSDEVPMFARRDDIPELSDIDISPSLVERKLSALNPSSAPGPDGCHPRVLREVRQVLSQPLALLYRRSLDLGTVPDEWKLARVVPIFKKGDKSNPGNYRPVSLTAVTCKILESLIRDRLLQHLSESDILSNDQHGFRPKRSCNTQLLEVLDNWSKAFESRDPVDVLYLDFCKAFDSVPHRRLLHKLSSYGVCGKLLSWIESFLVGRRQQVVVQGCSSDWTSVDSGVPQGSVLGPLLFLVYVNDLPNVVQGHIKMFADDTKIFSTVTSPRDSISLQADLDALTQWSDTWMLPFNEEKCKVLHLGRANKAYQYTMRVSPMIDSTLERDLGVHIDPELKFRQQASAAVSKATQVLAVIRRSFALLDSFTLPLLYKALVRPHLEFGNLVWGPFNRADEKLVERVQRRATRMVSDIRHLCYEERLRSLTLPSLYYRRKRGDMIYLYQIFSGGIDVNPDTFFIRVSDGITRGHPFKVLKPRATCRVRRSVLSVRAVNDWNSLPAEVVCSTSLNSFKSSLDAHWAQFWYYTPDS